MRCSCFFSNNYEIVGLCDIEKFNEKISEFQDKSWSQITISDNLNFLGNKPRIKNVTKTFISLQITSTKLINTPKSTVPNVEGLKLTGKLLLVAGEINQRVIYVSNCGKSDIIKSLKTTLPFTTYIIVDEDVDIVEDKFCIYSCIENASIRLIDECTLNQNVNLFLFAHRIERPKPPEPYPNEIIFKNDNNQELAKIIFETLTNTLEVTSTTNVEPGRGEIVIEFGLFDSDGKTKKGSSMILTGQQATQFVTDLDGKMFNYGDIININYFSRANRVEITNFSPVEPRYQPRFTKNEAFIVTENGLVPYILPNKVLSTNFSNRKIVEVNFSKFNNEIKVVSTGEISPRLGFRESYFILIVLDSMGTEKRRGIIGGNEDGRNLKGRLDVTNYSFGDRLYILSRYPGTSKVTNYPTSGSTYSASVGLERFKITQNGLVKIGTNYPNDVIFKNDNGDELAVVRFNLTNKKLFVSRTDNIEASDPRKPILQFILYASDGTTIKENGIIQGNVVAQEFVNALNEKDFEYGDVISVGYFDSPNRVKITNYPTDGNNYTPTVPKIERFRIGIDRLSRV